MTKKVTGFRLTKLAASVLALSAAMASYSEATETQFDIKARSLDKALAQLSEQSNTTIIAPQDLLAGKSAVSLSGSMTTDQALNKLLSGSGLEYAVQENGQFIIKAAASSEGAADEESEDLEEVVVTGTLIRNVNPTSHVEILGRDDFDRLGVSTVEDAIRTLPQNFGGINLTTTGLVGEGGGRNRSPILDRGFTSGGENTSLGVSGADLFGLGSAATLVLVDNRRVAGAASASGNTVDLSTIPLASVERIEVLLDGASSIYGSDAVGGVINIITRKDFVGGETSVRYENSANDADSYSLSQTFGFNWDSGKVSGSLSYQHRDPYNPVKVGHTSNDLTDKGGFNYASNSIAGQPGVLTAWSRGRPFFYTLNDDADQTGQNITFSDYSLVSNPSKELPQQVNFAPEVITKSANINLSQYLSEDVEVYANLSYSQTQNRQDGKTPILTMLVTDAELPGTPSAFDFVSNSYLAQAEVDAGLIPLASSESTSDVLSASFGFDMALPFKDWRLLLDGSYSLSTSDFDSTQSASSTEISALMAAYPGINLFGDGSVQDPNVALLVVPDITSAPEVSTKGIVAKADGELFEWDAGTVRMAIGAEYRVEARDYANDPTVIEEGSQFVGLSFSQQNAEPDRTVEAIFTQFSVPLIGEGQDVLGIQSLEMELGARWERASYKGESIRSETETVVIPGRPPVIDTITTVTVNEIDESYSDVTPSVGFSLRPNDDLSFNLRWSESFVAPTLNQLYGSTIVTNDFLITDPFAPGGSSVVSVSSTTGGNPLLEPERSDNYTFGVNWLPGNIEGLSVNATYKVIKFAEQIRTVSSILPLNQYLDPSNPLTIGIRDDAGNLLAIEDQFVNLATSEAETIDFNVRYDFSAGDVDGLYVAVSGLHTLKNEITAGNDYIEERAGTHLGPVDWKGKAEFGWNQPNYGANLILNYTSSYDHVDLVDPADPNPGNPELQVQEIEHYTSWDLTGYYSFDDSGWRVLGGVRNLTNAKPNFMNRPNVSFDVTNADPRGRVIYMEVKKSFEF